MDNTYITEDDMYSNSLESMGSIDDEDVIDSIDSFYKLKIFNKYIENNVSEYSDDTDISDFFNIGDDEAKSITSSKCSDESETLREYYNEIHNNLNIHHDESDDDINIPDVAGIVGILFNDNINKKIDDSEIISKTVKRLKLYNII